MKKIRLIFLTKNKYFWQMCTYFWQWDKSFAFFILVFVHSIDSTQHFYLTKKEKANLLEKVEHYERDLVSSCEKSFANVKSSDLGYHRSNGWRNSSLDSDSSFSDLNTLTLGDTSSSNYEFYYEKNVRPWGGKTRSFSF